MSDDNTTHILKQADALIRRHRIFVAASSPGGDDAILEEGNITTRTATGIDTDTDLPVLTEIVTSDEITLSPATGQLHLDAVRKEFSCWLDEELPGVVLKITDGLADQLVQQLTHQAESQLLPRLLACLESSVTQSGKSGKS